MPKRITRSSRRVALSRLLADEIAQPGPVAAALKARFGQAATALDTGDADVAWSIRWPAGHDLAGREFFTLDFEVAKARVLAGALVEPLHGRFLRGVGLHLPGATGGDPELVQLPATWVGPKNEKTAAAERLFAGDAVLSAAYAQAAWQPSRELQRDLIQAGRLVARVFGESVGPYEPVGFLDGEPEPQTLDEAFVLLRRLAERSGLSPMGVLKAFEAGNLAATSLGGAFPGLRQMQVADIGRVAVEWAVLGSTTESLRDCGLQGPVLGPSGCSCLCKACQASVAESGFRGAGQ